MNHLLNSHPGSEKVDQFGNEIQNNSSDIEDFEFHFSPCVKLDESQQAKLKENVKSKISEIGTELKQTHLTQLKIYVQGHDPIQQRYYHVSPEVREKINEKIDKMLKQGIIEPYCSDLSNRNLSLF